MKFSYDRLKPLLDKEWFVFVLINFIVPFAVLIFLQISYEFWFRLISVLSVQTVLLTVNIIRIRKGDKRFKWAYIVISVLNVLSFVLISDLSFATAAHSLLGIAWSYFYGPLPFWL